MGHETLKTVIIHVICLLGVTKNVTNYLRKGGRIGHGWAKFREVPHSQKSSIIWKQTKQSVSRVCYSSLLAVGELNLATCKRRAQRAIKGNKIVMN